MSRRPINKCLDKLCGLNKICNPETGRCVNTEGKLGKFLIPPQRENIIQRIQPIRKKRLEQPDLIKINKCEGKPPCEKGKICNPETGRCVNSRGKIGKTIMQNKCDNIICSKGKICNPNSGRCVNINGKIGQTIELPQSPVIPYLNRSPVICAVCLDDINMESDAAIKLHCGHIFHKNCIKGIRVKKCPLCRETINLRDIRNLNK